MSLTDNSRQSAQTKNSLRLAVSACLLGQKVRYDGAHKQHAFVCALELKGVDLIPICPEVEIGLGVPRPAIHIVERSKQLMALGVDDQSLDVTQKLNRYGRAMAKQLDGIDGYIFKARSPSCGVGSSPQKRADGRTKKGSGLFAAQIMQTLPLLPVVEETGLEDRTRQINFIQQVEAHRFWREFIALQPGVKQLREFHQNSYLNLMAHGVEGLRDINHWLDALPQNGKLNKTQRQVYAKLYMCQVKRLATHRRHEIVLRHLCVRLRSYLDKTQRQVLANMLNDYSARQLSIKKAIDELRLIARGSSLAWLAQQTYLQINLSLEMEK